MATNIRVDLRRGESNERLIRRFIKKCKKERILETYRQKVDYYVKPSKKRKMKSQKARRERLKMQRKTNTKLFR